MKKLLIASNVLLVAIIVILLYCNCKKCKGSEKPVTGFCKTADCYDSDGKEPEGMINYRLAVRMSQDYALDSGKYRVWEGAKKTDSMDARSIWFDLKKLKQFIAYIEQSVCNKKCNDSTILGIRFYYAKYPFYNEMQNSESLNLLGKNYERKHTLFMVPTFWNPGLGVNVDFDPKLTGDNCVLMPIDPIKGHVWLPHFIGDGDGDGGTGREQNHGSLMPPPAEAGTFPTTDK